MNDIRAKMEKQPAAFGAWVAIDSTVSAEMMATAGYDFVIVDTQHGSISIDGALPMLQLFDAHCVPALVRIDAINPAKIMRVLDLGASGVIVPMVSTPEQARTVAAAARYPPRGCRSFGPVRHFYSAEGVVDDPLCFVMVETAEALRNLDAIASTPDLDGVLVGPLDLALSLGLDLATAVRVPPIVIEAIDQVVAVCKRHNILSACPGFSLANAQELLKRGVQLITVSSDLQFIRRGTSADLEECRGWQRTPPHLPKKAR
jgi:4-hydroxy-2-oxoheptanedioate aldolase